MEHSGTGKVLFGTIRGVLIPNITMMFGVILFLRLGVITANAGIVLMTMAIALSLAIMVLTSLSIGTLCSNMQVGDGGVYYIISRTLGIEIGGAVGLVIYFAQLISISLTVSGFSLSLCELFPHLSLELVEVGTLVCLALLSGASAAWALQAQGVILMILLAALASVFLGSASFVEPPAEVVPFYKAHLGFWGCFAMLYPALTGIEAGMALSGSLRNPDKSLLYGNLYSLIFVAACYLLLCTFVYNFVPFPNLLSDPFALVDYARWPTLVRVGIWGATLSSALGCLLGAPRMLQSMAQDGILSEVFARVQGRNEEPRIAVAFTVLAGATIMLLTTIDQIIPMLAMICLVSYGMLNFVAAFCGITNIPSWRPAFRIPWQLSASGLALIIFTMFMISPGWTFATVGVLLAAYVSLRARSVESGFQDLRDSFVFFISRLALYRLEEGEEEHALTWHPQILALLPSPNKSERIVDLTHSLTRRSGILTFVTVIPEEWETQDRIQSTRALLSRYFEQRNVACLSDVYPCSSQVEGYKQLVKAYGIGSIQPNTVAIELGDKGIDNEFRELMDTCRVMQKNLLFFRDNDSVSTSYFRRRSNSKKKAIDIWWNPEDTQAFDLVWSLVTTLKDGMAFRDARVTIKASIAGDNAQDYVDQYLHSYLSKGRLKADVRLYDETEDVKDAAPLSFVCLSSIPDEAEEEARHAYMGHIQDAVKRFGGQGLVAFVTTHDGIDHRAIYVDRPSEAPAVQDS
jgi:amino acid transporter